MSKTPCRMALPQAIFRFHFESFKKLDSCPPSQAETCQLTVRLLRLLPAVAPLAPNGYMLSGNSFDSCVRNAWLGSSNIDMHSKTPQIMQGGACF